MGYFTGPRPWDGPRLGRIVGAAALAVVTVGVPICSKLNDYEYSRGTRVGVVNKFSERGLIWKTYEGQMALEGIVSDGNRMGANVWNFSIDDQARHGENGEELARKLNETTDSQEKVKIRYVQVLGGWSWRGSTGYYVQSVEPVGKK